MKLYEIWSYMKYEVIWNIKLYEKWSYMKYEVIFLVGYCICVGLIEQC